MRRTLFLLVLAALAAGTLLVAAGPAAAADDRFSCRASAARIDLLGGPPVEPVLANDKNDPCVTETRSGNPPQAGGVVSVGAAQAQTVGTASLGAASARVADVGVNLGPGLLPLQISVEGVNVEASAYCQGTGVVFGGSGRVGGISINGIKVDIPDPSAPVDIEVGDILKVHLNQATLSTRGGLTEVVKRAVSIESKLLATNITLGEVRAGIAGKPCGAGGVQTPTPGPVTTIRVPVAGISPGIVPGACATKPFKVAVRGRGIARTVFSIDGKVVARVGRNNAPSFKIDPAKVAIGRHTVRARVFFLNNKVRPKTLSFVFGRCAVVIPATAQFGKCANVRVTSTRPGKVFVKLTSGPASVRQFGSHLFTFTRPGTRVVCIRIPLRARDAFPGTTRTFAIAVRVGGKNYIRRIRVS